MTTDPVKPSIPDVVERFADYKSMPGNGMWGSLHIVLDDGNVEKQHVEWVAEYAREKGDVEGEALGRILLQMSMTQRKKLPHAVKAFLKSRDAPPEPQRLPGFQIVYIRNGIDTLPPASTL